MAVIKDTSWVKNAFFAKSQSDGEGGSPRRASTFTSAVTKYTDTAPGGNFSLNNPPQHSPLADPRVKGRMPNNGGKSMNSSFGQGVKYSEVYDDNSHLIYMRFGHASFSSISAYIANIFDYESHLMATTGRKPGFFYAAGYAAGLVTQLPFLGYIMFAKGLSLIYSALSDGATSTNYMSIKPAMHEFWGSVSWIYNSIGVNQELVWPYSAENPSEIDADLGRRISELAPGIVSPNGLVDIFSVALRAQRLANEHRRNILSIIDSTGDSPDEMFAQLRNMSLSDINMNGAYTSYESYMEVYTGMASNTESTGDAKESTLSRKEYEKSWWDKMSDVAEDFSGNLGSAMTDGADWLCLRVTHQSDHTISLSNSTKSNPLADKVNDAQSKVKDLHYSMAGGNIGDGAVASMVESVITGGKDFVQGAAASWGFGGAAMLLSGAMADIPNIWDSSTMEIPSTTYKIDIDLPYGNLWADYLHATPVICALMAAAMPISSGKYSYTAPFYCELYDKSRAQIRRGMVTDVEIKRGTHEIGMTNDRRPLGYEISFTIADLNEIYHMPLDPNDNVWDGDSAFSDLLAVYSGTDIYTQFYQYPKLKMKMRKAAVAVQQSLSTSQAAMGFRNTLVGRSINAFMRMGDYK